MTETVEATKRAALARAKRATLAADRAYALRDEAIQGAAEVASLREIAEATSLSKPRVQQIVAAGAASPT